MSRVLYVAGTSYTGSTLLSFLLNAHPEMTSVGEVTGPIALFEDQRGYPCSCGETLADCPFWRATGAAMQKRGFTFGPNHWDLGFELGGGRVTRQLLSRSLRSRVLDDLRDSLVLRIPPLRDRLQTIARRNEAFVASALEVTGKRVFVDGNKDAMRAAYLHRLTDLDLFIVHLVRDSPGFVSSFMKNAGGSLEAGVRTWNRTAAHARRLAARVGPERMLRVRYEDLCTTLEDEIARIVRFCGLEPRPGPIDFRAAEHHVIGNRMRLAGSSEVVLDEAWRERLTDEQIARILRRTALGRRQAGYGESPGTSG